MNNFIGILILIFGFFYAYKTISKPLNLKGSAKRTSMMKDLFASLYVIILGLVIIFGGVNLSDLF